MNTEFGCCGTEIGSRAKKNRQQINFCTHPGEWRFMPTDDDDADEAADAAAYDVFLYQRTDDVPPPR